MSELESFESERIYWAVEQVEREAGDIADLHLDDNLFYIKSEADKVIAELKEDYKEACDRLQTANLIKDEQLAAARHHKYKRCLAMAKWCMTEYLHSKCIDFTNTEQWYWRRWYIRWRNLAKKFKEAK